MSVRSLHIFTIHFPLGEGEGFLYTELLHLSAKFEKIYLVPMYLTAEVSRYTLPANVEVLKFNMFQPYNRLKLLMKHKWLIAKIVLTEIAKGPDGMKYIRQCRSSLNDLMHKLAAAGMFEEFLREKQQSLEIAYTYWFNQWTFILSFLHQKKPRFRLLSRIHGSDVYEDQHPERNFFFRFRTFQLGEIATVLPISDNGLRHFMNKNHLSSQKLCLSRLGTEDFGEGPSDSLPVRRVVSCSALQPYKRVHLLIDLLGRMETAVEWIHFGDGELKEEILKQAKTLPTHISFNWMGAQNNHSVIEYYKNNAVDLFINVSSSEGIPVSVMEAISFGIPVMATNVGGVSEIVNEQTGILIDKNFDPGKTALILERFFRKTGAEKMAIRKSARTFWDRNYNARYNYEKLFTQLVNG